MPLGLSEEDIYNISQNVQNKKHTNRSQKQTRLHSKTKHKIINKPKVNTIKKTKNQN